MKQIYNAILSGKDGEYISVCFPDFPGCVTGGDDLTEAMENAREALEFHIEGMEKDDEEIPDHSSRKALEELLAESKGDFCRIGVIEVEVPDKVRERVNITLSRFVLSRIDNFAAKRNRTRSAMIAEASMDYIRKHV